jgi:microcystin-dependent protein
MPTRVQPFTYGQLVAGSVKTSVAYAAFCAAVCFILCANARSALAGINPFLGEVETLAFGFCPQGWAPLNGQLLPINQNQALFALLGTTYGGDGVTTFALPTAKPIFTANESVMLQCIALQGVFPSRN